MIVKNTYGISVTFSTSKYGKAPKTEFTGSALQRKKQVKKYASKSNKKESIEVEKSMSPRTKQKIKKKIMCFSRTQKRLSFVTLTFLNTVTDKQAIFLLRKFIDNVKKRSKDFQYIWVIERQTKNDAFKGNPHFHMITNKYWDIKKWWEYWINLQQKNGIVPREKDFKPSSAFDVKQIHSNNRTKLSSYVTKYVTKNNAKFKCQVWNCSKKVSQLYTDFYSKEAFTKQFERLNAISMIYEDRTHNSPVKDVKIIQVNKKTLPLYSKLDAINKNVLKMN